jgi:hypothetical protein
VAAKKMKTDRALAFMMRRIFMSVPPFLSAVARPVAQRTE